jgi:two-component system sensor histidine kinase AtoS
MHQAQILLIFILSLVIVLVVFYLVKAMVGYHRRKAEQGERETTHVGFVVETFHDLVSKLKEKERELDILRKKAEERASSIELYNENIFQSVPSGVVSFDQDLRITKINFSAMKMLALGDEVILGRAYDEIFHSPMSELIRERRSVERAETAYTTQGGKRLWIGLTLSPLRDSTDAVIGQILIFTDLTELKAFQSQKELRERLSTLGEMSAGIAHELRNPMAVISGYTKILSKKADDSLKPAVTAISREVGVMDRIITDFLSFARPAEPVFSPVDLDSLLKSCRESFDGSAAHVRVSLDPGASCIVRADEVLLRQAFTNLIQNAIDAMPEGGEVRIKTSRGDHLSISVADTGHGIPENLRDKIFLPFYTTKERGTGLGLSIVHKIIVSHGGTVKVDTSSQGTTFTILLQRSTIIENNLQSQGIP